MLSLTGLDVARAVAETGSATRASQVLHMTQPAVSYHLKQLDQHYGTALFRRGPAGLSLTQAGLLVVEAAESIHRSLAGLETEVEQLVSKRGQVLRITSACFTNYHWLPDVLERFRSRVCDANVEIDLDPSRKPFERLDRGEIDLALTTVPPPGKRFRTEELFDDEIVAVVRPDDPLGGRSFLTARDFAERTVLIFDRRQSDLFTQVLQPAGIQPNRVTEVAGTEALLGMIRSGLGISAMARWVAEPELDLGRLVDVRITRTGIRRTWSAVFSTIHDPSAATHVFVQALREVRGLR